MENRVDYTYTGYGRKIWALSMWQEMYALGPGTIVNGFG